MTLTRALTATFFLVASTSAFADSYDADALLYLQSSTPAEAAEDATSKLRAAADANPNLEWHEGSEGEADSMVMLSDVLFDFGTSQLNPGAVSTLASIAKELKDVPGIEIAGHTDNIGTEADNLELAKARADSVRSWLIENAGVTPDQLITVSMGETQPIAANILDNGADNPDGRSKNRRVEFHILEEEAPKTTAQVSLHVSTSNAI